MAANDCNLDWEDEMTINDHVMNGSEANGCSVLGIGRGKFADNQRSSRPSFGKGRGRFPSISNTEDNSRPEFGKSDDGRKFLRDSTSSRNSFRNNERKMKNSDVCYEDNTNRNSLGSKEFSQRNKRCYKESDTNPNSFGIDGTFAERKARGSRNECYKCQQEGHFARECPNVQNEESESAATGSSRKSGVCFNCQEKGHISSQCEKQKRTESGEMKPPPVTYIPVEDDDDKLFQLGVAAGVNFSAFDHVEVKVSGCDEIASKANNFNDMGLRKILINNVNQAGYKTPTPIQKHAVPIIMSGRDLMACAQTGSGKTAAFLLPVLHKILENDIELDEKVSPIVLILSPTRELAVQIFNEARKFAYQSVLKICLVYGGVQRKYQNSRLEKGCQVLVATTGRLLDFLRNGDIDFHSLRVLILDEADRMLDLGFKADIDTILEHPSMPNTLDRQTLMFSATFSPNVQQLAKMYLKDYLFIATGLVGSANTDVRQTILEVEQNQKRDTLEGFINDELELNGNQKLMVFVETKRMTDFTACYLLQHGINATSIHGDRTQEQREEAIREFKSGKRNVLVATAVAARGLDIEGVGVVVNYDMPKDIDEYVHRIGRTGRVGNPGRAVSYFQVSSDAHLAKSLVQLLMNAHQEVPDFLDKCSELDVGISFRGRPKFGALDIRHIKTEEYPAAAAVGGPMQPMEVTPNDEDVWDV